MNEKSFRKEILKIQSIAIREGAMAALDQLGKLEQQIGLKEFSEEERGALNERLLENRLEIMCRKETAAVDLARSLLSAMDTAAPDPFRRIETIKMCLMQLVRKLDT